MELIVDCLISQMRTEGFDDLLTVSRYVSTVSGFEAEQSESRAWAPTHHMALLRRQ